MYRVEVYDRSGTPLAELDNLAACRWSYVLNKAGSAAFDIGVTHPKATQEFLAHHNIVMIYHDELEPWGGYITDVSWPSSGDIISVTCASVHQRLGLRRTDVLKFTQARVADIFSSLIVQGNRVEHTGVYVGAIAAGDIPLDFEVRRESVYERLQDLLEKGKVEWHLNYVNPSVWTADLRNRVGQDLTGSVFVQAGFDTDGLPDYSEELGDLANAIVGIGTLPEGFQVPEGEDDYKYRPIASWEVADSIRLYGRSEDAVEFDTDVASTLADLTRTEAEKRAWPHTTLQLSINRKRGLWSAFTDGDTIAVQLPSYAFTGLSVPIRVLGREVDDAAGVMTIAGEVVVGNDAKTLDMYKYAHYGSAVRPRGSDTDYPEGGVS